MEAEDRFLVEHRLPFVRLQAKELGEEVVKLLKQAEEDVEADDRPPITTSTVSWLPAPSDRAWLSGLLHVEGCLVRRAKLDMTFPAKRGFAIELSPDIDTPWVLEQLLAARKHVEKALDVLDEGVLEHTDLKSLCEDLDEAVAAFTHARNMFIVPNALGFPRTLRPFNGFAPVLAREYMVELSVQRSALVVTCLRVEHTPARTDGPPALVPDPWFGGGDGLVGLHVEFESRGVTVLEQHTCATHVAFFDKALALINEARTTVLDLRENVVALLQPRMFPSLGGEAFELAQPGEGVCAEWVDYLADAPAS